MQCVVASAGSKRMTSSTQGFLKGVGQAVSVIFVVMKGIAIANMDEAILFKNDCRRKKYGRLNEYCCVGYAAMARLRLHPPHSKFGGCSPIQSSPHWMHRKPRIFIRIFMIYADAEILELFRATVSTSERRLITHHMQAFIKRVSEE